jgi:hypothetical protein
VKKCTFKTFWSNRNEGGGELRKTEVCWTDRKRDKVVCETKIERGKIKKERGGEEKKDRGKIKRKGEKKDK